MRLDTGVLSFAAAGFRGMSERVRRTLHQEFPFVAAGLGTGCGLLVKRPDEVVVAGLTAAQAGEPAAASVTHAHEVSLSVRAWGAREWCLNRA